MSYRRESQPCGSRDLEIRPWPGKAMFHAGGGRGVDIDVRAMGRRGRIKCVDERVGRVLHEDGAPIRGGVVGGTKASRVLVVVRCSEAVAGMVTRLEPLKTRALPNVPCVLRVRLLLSVPVLLPEA
jgi:hypothetical protein